VEASSWLRTTTHRRRRSPDIRGYRRQAVVPAGTRRQSRGPAPPTELPSSRGDTPAYYPCRRRRISRTSRPPDNRGAAWRLGATSPGAEPRHRRVASPVRVRSRPPPSHRPAEAWGRRIQRSARRVLSASEGVSTRGVCREGSYVIAPWGRAIPESGPAGNQPYSHFCFLKNHSMPRPSAAMMPSANGYPHRQSSSGMCSKFIP
jgi:hypothetical protein